MTPTKYAEDHLKVKETVEKMRKETGGSTCIIISELSKEIKMDPRLLRKHLEVMEIDGYGHFTNPQKRHLFCSEKK